MRRPLRLLPALLCFLVACEETEDGITGPCGFGNPCAVDPVAGVHLSPPTRLLVPGDTITLSASALDASGSPVDAQIEFLTSDSAIATIDAAGLVEAIAPGSATITARSGVHESSLMLEIRALLATSVSAGEDVSCVTTSVPGRAQCWGLDDAGQLGFAPDTACFADDTLIAGALGCAVAPRLIRRELALVQVSAGDSLSCALDEVGAAWCWGDNRFGQLGVGGVSAGDGPQRVTAPGGAFSTVSAGGRHACGIAADITYCWGEDSLGQLGDARRINSTTPIPVVTADTFTRVTAGQRHTCALSVNGRAFCWGNNEAGQLGTGSVGGSTSSPSAVVGAHVYTAIAAGDSSTCAVRTDGAVLCWGANTHGQLGRGTTAPASGTPAQVTGGITAIEVTVGSGFACAIDAAGAARCWGSNDYGQLGSPGGPTPTPRPVDGEIAFASISAGVRHACGTTVGGAVHCWGSNVFGALGNGLQAAARGTPVPVSLTR